MAHLETEYAIRKLFSDSTSVTDIVSTRMYPEGMVPSDVDVPFLTIARRDSNHLGHIANRNNYVMRSLQINAYSDTDTELISLSEAIRVTADRYAGTVSLTSGMTTYDVTIDHCHITGETRTSQREADGSGIILAQLTVDLDVGHGLPSS